MRSLFAIPAWRAGVLARAVDTGASWAFTVVAGYLVFDLTHRAVAVALVTLLSRAPAIAVGVHAGTLADAADVGRASRVLCALQALPAAVLAVLAWSGAVRASELELGALALAGLAGFSTPCMQLALGALVPAELKARATAAANALGYAAGLLGAAIAGVVLELDGPRVLLAGIAATQLGVAIGFLRVTTPDRRPLPRRPVREVAATVPAPAWRIVATLAFFACVVGPVAELAPVIARRHGAAPHLLGLCLGAVAVGGLLAAPAVAALDRRGIARMRALPAVLVAAGTTLLLLAAWRELALTLVALALCGACIEAFSLETLLELRGHAPEGRVGHVVGLWVTASAAGVALGALALGHVIDRFGIATGLAASAMLCVVAAAALPRLLRPTGLRTHARPSAQP